MIGLGADKLHVSLTTVETSVFTHGVLISSVLKGVRITEVIRIKITMCSSGEHLTFEFKFLTRWLLDIYVLLDIQVHRILFVNILFLLKLLLNELG